MNKKTDPASDEDLRWLREVGGVLNNPIIPAPVANDKSRAWVLTLEYDNGTGVVENSNGERRTVLVDSVSHIGMRGRIVNVRGRIVNGRFVPQPETVEPRRRDAHTLCTICDTEGPCDCHDRGEVSMRKVSHWPYRVIHRSKDGSGVVVHEYGFRRIVHVRSYDHVGTSGRIDERGFFVPRIDDAIKGYGTTKALCDHEREAVPSHEAITARAVQFSRMTKLEAECLQREAERETANQRRRNLEYHHPDGSPTSKIAGLSLTSPEDDPHERVRRSARRIAVMKRRYR